MKVMAIALLLACGSAVAADQSPVVELATPVQSAKALGDAKALNLPIEAAARIGEIEFHRDRLVDLGRERLVERANGRAAAGGRFSVELFPGERFTLEHQQTER